MKPTVSSEKKKRILDWLNHEKCGLNNDKLGFNPNKLPLHHERLDLYHVIIGMLPENIDQKKRGIQLANIGTSTINTNSILRVPW
jgi:hypothetical protein